MRGQRLLCLAWVVWFAWGCEGSEQAVTVPVVERIEPLSAKVGEKVAIKGKGFGGDASQVEVLFDGAVAVIESVRNTEIETRVPKTAETGIVRIRVRAYEMSYSQPFTVHRPIEDRFSVTAIEPLYGEIGTPIRIKGNQFGTNEAAVTIEFVKTKAKITQISNHELVTAVPSGARSGNITIRKEGEAPIIFSDPFTVVKPPIGISSIVPLYGQVGTSITIHGHGFGTDQSNISIFFGSKVATISTLSDIQIQTAVPAQASIGRIRIHKKNLSPIDSNTNFIVLSTSASFSITGISPIEGAVGTAVTIAGNGFGTDRNNVEIYFGGIKGPLTHLMDTEARTIVPANATSAPIILIKNQATALASTQTFTVK